MEIQGYYGCDCHPHETMEDYKKYLNQKIEIGATYKNRCTQVLGIATGISPTSKQFIELFVEPYDCARCNQSEHKQNLIKQS